MYVELNILPHWSGILGSPMPIDPKNFCEATLWSHGICCSDSKRPSGTIGRCNRSSRSVLLKRVPLLIGARELLGKKWNEPNFHPTGGNW